MFLLPFFNMYMFGMSFYIISGTKKSDIIFKNCVLYQFNVVDVNKSMSQGMSG